MSAPWSPATTPTRHGNPCLDGCYPTGPPMFVRAKSSLICIVTTVVYLRLPCGHFCHGYGDKKEMWKTKGGGGIQRDEDAMVGLNPEGRDVMSILSGGPVIVVRLVCLSYPLRKFLSHEE